MKRRFNGVATAVLSLLIPVIAAASGPGPGVTSDFYVGDDRAETQSLPLAVVERARQPQPVLTLPAAPLAEPQRLEAMGQWNRGVLTGTRVGAGDQPTTGRRALKNGFERSLATPREVSFGVAVRTERSVPGPERAQSADPANAKDRAAANVDAQPARGPTRSVSNGIGTGRTDELTVWSETIEVEGAHRLRLKLDNLDVGPDSQFWVADAEGRLYGPFDTRLMDLHGTLWTPSVFGSTITLIATVPARGGGARFRVASVGELFSLDAKGQPKLDANPKNDLPCAEDAQCHGPSSFSAIEEAQSAIGSYVFVSGGDSFVCSGGLVNDNDPNSFIPYFLTANHCLSTGAEASTVEVVWDFYTNSCNGSTPNLGNLDRSNGATLLQTGAFADFTFLQLNNVPGGRWFLGWEAGRNAIGNGTVLHRISHPGGGTQVYSRTAVNDPPPFSCSGLPTSSFIYSSQLLGGTAGGSSGAPVLLDNGRIVGQFFGDCGEDLSDNCNYDNLAVDGGLFAFFDRVSSYLENDSNAAADLAVTEVTGPGGARAPGTDFDVATTVENIGAQLSNSYRITFYLSTDTNITSSDRSLGFVDREALGPGARHNRLTTVTVPGDLTQGTYYVGVIVTGGDGNTANNVRHDPNPIQVDSSSFAISPALNGAWFDPATAGQGLLIEVYPGIGKVFMAWFTFDTQQPANAEGANLGATGQRWLTGLGDINGNRVQFDVALTRGALFNQVDPPAQTSTGYGTVTLEFAGCNSAVLTYLFPRAARSGSIQLQRITGDSVTNCQTIQGLYGR